MVLVLRFWFQFQFRFDLVYVGCFVCYFDSLLCVVWTDCMPVSMHFHESPCKVKWHFMVCLHFAFGCWMLDTRFGAIALILTEKVFLRKSHSGKTNKTIILSAENSSSCYHFSTLVLKTHNAPCIRWLICVAGY